MDSNIFYLQRFASYFKLSLTQSKYLLRLFTASLAVFVLLTTLIPYFTDFYSDLQSYRYIDKGIDYMWAVEMRYFIIGFFCIISASAAHMFFSMSSKEKRINTLMIPASYLEKYLSNFILYIIGGIIVVLITSYAADLFRALVAPLYAPADTYIAPMPLGYYFTGGFDYTREIYSSHNNDVLKAMYAFVIGGGLLIQAYFALSSILWNKHSLSKGIGIGIGLTTLFVLIIVWSMKTFYRHLTWTPRFAFLENFNCLILIVWSLLIITTITFYVIAYFRFKESESINRW